MNAAAKDVNTLRKKIKNETAPSTAKVVLSLLFIDTLNCYQGLFILVPHSSMKSRYS